MKSLTNKIIEKFTMDNFLILTTILFLFIVFTSCKTPTTPKETKTVDVTVTYENGNIDTFFDIDDNKLYISNGFLLTNLDTIANNVESFIIR